MSKIFFLNKKIKLILIVSALIFFLFLLFTYVIFPENIIEVKVVPVKKGQVESSVTATSSGTVSAEIESKVASDIAGKVIAVFILDGALVKKGDPILKIDLTDSLIQKQQGLANANSAKAKYLQAKQKLNQSEINYKRNKELFKEGIVSASQLEAAEFEYKTSKEELKAAQENMEALKSSFNLLSHQVTKGVIKAPFSGVASKIYPKIGEFINVGSPVADMFTTEKIKIKGRIDEADLNKIKLNQKVRLTPEAYRDKKITGELVFISPVVLTTKEANREIEIEVLPKEGIEYFKPGMSIDIEIILDSVGNVLFIPSYAIMDKKGEKIVYIADGSRAKEVSITAGMSNYETTEIKRGLKEGDLVILPSNISKINDNAKIKVIR